jgi:hypothetical protein
VAIVLTPVIYVAERRIEKYVGEETAQSMKRMAMGNE